MGRVEDGICSGKEVLIMLKLAVGMSLVEVVSVVVRLELLGDREAHPSPSEFTR